MSVLGKFAIAISLLLLGAVWGAVLVGEIAGEETNTIASSASEN